MGGAEGVVDEDVAERGHPLRASAGSFFFSPRLRRQFSSMYELARRRTLDAAEPVAAASGTRAAQQFAEAGGDRRQRVFRLRGSPSLRPTEVRGDHHRRAGGERHLDGRQRGADAGVLGDAAGVVLRHVEVGANEDATAGGACRRRSRSSEAENVHFETAKGRAFYVCGSTVRVLFSPRTLDTATFHRWIAPSHVREVACPEIAPCVAHFSLRRLRTPLAARTPRRHRSRQTFSDGDGAGALSPPPISIAPPTAWRAPVLQVAGAEQPDPHDLAQGSTSRSPPASPRRACRWSSSIRTRRTLEGKLQFPLAARPDRQRLRARRRRPHARRRAGREGARPAGFRRHRAAPRRPRPPADHASATTTSCASIRCWRARHAPSSCASSSRPRRALQVPLAYAERVGNVRTDAAVCPARRARPSSPAARCARPALRARGEQAASVAHTAKQRRRPAGRSRCVVRVAD